MQARSPTSGRVAGDRDAANHSTELEVGAHHVQLHEQLEPDDAHQPAPTSLRARPATPGVGQLVQSGQAALRVGARLAQGLPVGLDAIPPTRE